MEFEQVLATEIQKIDKAITTFLRARTFAREDAFVRHYHDTIERYIMAGGKRLRPFLCVQAFQGVTRSSSENIYRPSTSVEFLHNASLIHDDIIDRDDTRRGNPAFHYLFRQYYTEQGYTGTSAEHFGTTMGILGGDSTFFIGLEALQADFPPELNEKAIALYCKAYHEICDGVLMEMNFVHLPSISRDQYLRMIALKTGALIEKALLIGATYARATPTVMQALSTYAINLGMAFQIKDDLLGTFGDPARTGKPVDGDIKDGKKTLLLIEALDRSEGAKKQQILDRVGQDGLPAADVDMVRDAFRDSGAVTSCDERIQHYSTLANETIDGIQHEFDAAQAKVLNSLVTFNLRRDK